MGKPNKEKKKHEQKRLAEKKDPVVQARLKAEKQEHFKENIKFILGFTAKALLPAIISILIFAIIYKALPDLPQNKAFCGIGFIGAGCIIVTKNRRVKGLTTAAGLCHLSWKMLLLQSLLHSCTAQPQQQLQL